MQPEWLSKWEKSRNLSTHKIMQPLHAQNHTTSRNISTKKKSWASSQEKHKTSAQKNRATSPHTKSRKLSTKRITQTFRQKKTSLEFQNAALRTSHWLSNVSNCSFQKYWDIKYFFTVVTVVRKITQPLHKKNTKSLNSFFTTDVRFFTSFLEPVKGKSRSS